ncbi:uncharacterized protein METZ01_LOCUS516535, partial [marine metagenome]
LWIILQSGILFSANTGDIVITEFFFEPSIGSDIYEYIEIYNTTQDTIDFYNWIVEIEGVEYLIDDSLKIYPYDYFILYGNTGSFSDSEGTTYCSSFDFHPVYNNCDDAALNLYWLQFSNLPDGAGVINIFDTNTKLIDSIIYDATWSELIGSINAGKSVEFILDPLATGHLNNDDSSNWRSSQHSSDWLWNGSGYEKGSPLTANFIKPSIETQVINESTSYIDPNTGN